MTIVYALSMASAHAGPYEKGVENIYNKYKQPFTFDANVERLCAEEIEQGLNRNVGDIRNGKRITRETNAESLKKAIAMLQARDLQEVSNNHSTLAHRRVSPDLICITKALVLQKMPISKRRDDKFGELLHGLSRSQSTPFSIAGSYYRTGNNSWAVIPDGDERKVYLEIEELRKRLFERATTSAPPTAGKITSPNSTENHYEGETLNGKKHGQGVYTWANGDRFVGEFKDDRLYSGKVIKPSGEVTMVYLNGVLTVVAPNRR